MIVCVYRPGTMYRVGRVSYRVSYRECGWCGVCGAAGYNMRRALPSRHKQWRTGQHPIRADVTTNCCMQPRTGCIFGLCVRVPLSRSTALACPISEERAGLSTTVAQHALVQHVSWSCVHAVCARHRALSIKHPLRFESLIIQIAVLCAHVFGKSIGRLDMLE
jgi:hypothetical protein